MVQVLRAIDVAVSKARVRWSKARSGEKSGVCTPGLQWGAAGQGAWQAAGCPMCGPVHGPMRHRAWLGHAAWHVLTSVGIAVCVDYAGAIVEPYCR